MKPESDEHNRDSPHRFALGVEHDPSGEIEIRVAGELDISSATELAEVLACTLATSEPCRIVLDLDDVDFIDSSGLAALVNARKLAASTHHQLTIRCESSAVHPVFESTGLLETLIRDD